MKKYICSLSSAFLCLVLTLPCTPSQAEELDIINRPVNVSGLTGLLFTTSPYTLPKGSVELGISILNETSDVPKYTITEFPVSVTVGLPKNSELALKTSYFNVKEPLTGPGASSYQRKTGNLELSYKWNFLPQQEDSIRPALAFIMTGIIPTDNYQDKVIDGVNHWGIRFGLSTGTDINWRDYLLGIYADVQAQGQDLTQKDLRDLYGIFNVGLLFPISKYRNLQMFVEYTLVFGRDRVTLAGGDYSGLTFGVRLVSERFNLSVGSQFLYKQAEGYDNSSRLIGMLTMKL
jgi:hypothetical protein